MSSAFTTRICGQLFLTGLLGLGSTTALMAQSTSETSSAQTDLEQEITDAYLAAYRLCKESEQLAEKKNWRLAITRAQEAERALAAIVRDHPLWRKNLLVMRRKMNADHLLMCRTKAKDSTVGNMRDPSVSGGIPINIEQGVGLPATNTPAIGGSTNQDLSVAPGVITDNKQLYNELMRAREELRLMAEAYKVLRNKSDEAAKALTVAQYELKTNKEKYERLQADIEKEREAGNQVVRSLNEQLLELETKLRASELSREDAVKRADTLYAELSALKVEHQRVLNERDTLTAENARLREIVELNTPEKIKSLLDQNISLSTQLDDARRRIDDLNAQVDAQGDENSILQQQLAAARGEEQRLNEEITRIYDENRGYRRRISELNDQTQDLEQNLADQESSPSIDPAIQEENQLLRGIIAKQKRTIKSQQDSRDLLFETYKHLKNQDPAIISALKRMDEESGIELSTVERELLAAAVAQPNDPSAGATAVRAGLELEALAEGAAKAFESRRYTAAEQLYRTLIEAKPDHLAGLVNFGMILLYRDKCEEAITYLDRAGRINPNQPLSFFMSATASYRLNQLDAAQAKFIHTLQLDPGNADAFFYLANIEGLYGEHEKALQHLAAALKLNPNLPDAHYNMARIYIESGNLADAARAYDRAVQAGASPDVDLEDYLRAHKSEEQKLGVDLLDLVEPDQEALQLGELESESKYSSNFVVNREKLQLLLSDGASLEQVRSIVEVPVNAAPTASPAGKGHAMPEEAFSKKSVKLKGKKTKVLRVKKSGELKLRLRGTLMPAEEE